MGEILPNGEVGGYEGYCPNCRKVIKTNIQGNEIGSHVCNSQNKQVMKIQKQDVEVWVKADEELPNRSGLYHCIYDHNNLTLAFEKSKNKKGFHSTIELKYLKWLKSIKDVYILTETQLETLKQEYYGIGITEGLREAELKLNK